jgi:predicted lipoprotein with Yx(FWY)xxD motif
MHEPKRPASKEERTMHSIMRHIRAIRTAMRPLIRGGTSRTTGLLAAGLAGALLLAACGGAAKASSGGGSTLTVGSKPVGSFGAVLVNSSGMTLYYLKGETASKITCTGACATEWPPFLLPAGKTAVAGASGVNGTFATVKRPDSGTQVTFDGHPLYTFVADKSAGQATGQGVENFFVATASGMAASGGSSGGRGGYGNGGY